MVLDVILVFVLVLRDACFTAIERGLLSGKCNQLRLILNKRLLKVSVYVWEHSFDIYVIHEDLVIMIAVNIMC